MIMDSEEYDSKVKQLLQDTSTYTPLEEAPTPKLKGELVNILKECKEDNVMSNQLYRQLYPKREEVPKFYGLPKIHKKDYPLRPVMPNVGSISHPVAKYLANTMGPLVGQTPQNVNNSVDFANKISDVFVPPGQTLVSYDVSSLFTSIPVPDALQCAKAKLESESSWREKTTLSLEHIIKLLEFVLSATCFVYRGTSYKQIHMCAMGSPNVTYHRQPIYGTL